jgi:DNA-binding beta-propeller fold protein YncE
LTHTVYVANNGSGSSGSVSVVNADTCNATYQGGCSGSETLTVPGGNADVLAVDVATGTLYVGTETATGSDLVSVFNASTCNAIYTGGCGQVPGSIAFGSSGGAPGDSEPNIAVDQVTNTIYATDTYDFSTTWTSPGLYMINGATCDAAHTGCDQAPVLMPLGLSSTTATGPGTLPWGVAVDEATDTVYVALFSNGDYAADVAVVNGASCNGYVTNGCNQVATQVPVGHNAIGITLDPFTHDVYTANYQDASASVIDGAVCNGSVTSGCDRAAGKLPAAHAPASIVADPAVGTLYVAGLYALSVLPLVP